MPPIAIIDAHLDLAWNALSWNRDLTQSLAVSRAAESSMTDHPARGHATVALPEMRRGGIALCLGTLLARTNPKARPFEGHTRRNLDYATQDIASATASGQLAYYRLLRDRGEIEVIDSPAALDRHWQLWQQGQRQRVGVIIAMEGADPIVTPAQAARWFADGLRCVGLAHYGRSAYAVGTGDAGPLTPAGAELLHEMDRLDMILDLTHSSDPSFFQALEHFAGPILASHNNCRALVPGDRQYSDEQIRLLIQRKGVIGVACDAWMLTPDYVRGQTPRESITLAHVADQIDHICQVAGNADHVGIGSDLDGGFGTEQTPHEIDSIADLQKLEPILRQRGYSETAVANVFHGNWLRFFRENLPN
jgi:membrane dipeptidase